MLELRLPPTRSGRMIETIHASIEQRNFRNEPSQISVIRPASPVSVASREQDWISSSESPSFRDDDPWVHDQIKQYYWLESLRKEQQVVIQKDSAWLQESNLPLS